MAEYSEKDMVLDEAYLAVGSMADDLGIFNHEKVRALLDNLSQHKRVHKDIIPWPSVEEMKS